MSETITEEEKAETRQPRSARRIVFVCILSLFVLMGLMILILAVTNTSALTPLESQLVGQWTMQTPEGITINYHFHPDRSCEVQQTTAGGTPTTTKYEWRIEGNTFRVTEWQPGFVSWLSRRMGAEREESYPIQIENNNTLLIDLGPGTPALSLERITE